MRKCISCGILKDESQFEKENPSWPLFKRCEDCRSEEENRLWFSSHPNASRAQREAHRKAYEASRAAHKAWVASVSAKAQAWNESHPATPLTRVKWMRSHREEVRWLQEEAAWSLLRMTD